MSQQETGGQASGDVQQEQQAFHEEAQQAQAAFAGAADVPGGAGAVESEADAPLSAGQTQPAGGDAGGGMQGGGGAAAGGGGERQYDEPSTGEMLASELGSEPSMQWEGKIAEKLSGSEGETTGTEKA